MVKVFECLFSRWARNAFSILLLWCLSFSALYANTLQVKLSSLTSEQGKYIKATIHYQGEFLHGDIDLDEWRDDFFVDAIETERYETKPGIGEVIQKVRLYPRRTGQFKLNSIAFGGAIAPAQSIFIQPSIRNGVNADPQLAPVMNRYWSGELIELSVDINLHDPGNILDVDDWEPQGFELKSVQQSRSSQSEVHTERISWLLYSRQPGRYSLELPAIHQRGGGRFRYHLPKIKLQIQPIPAYLPHTVPVGAVTIDSMIESDENSPEYLLIDLSHPGQLPQQVEGMRTLFDELGVSGFSVRTDETTDQQPGSVHRRYRIPIPDWILLQQHPLQVTYFDTETGSLNTIQHKLPAVLKMPVWAWLVIIITVSLVNLLMFHKLGVKIKNWQQHLHYMKAIRRSDNPEQLRQVILLKSCSKHLKEWTRKNEFSQSATVYHQLNQACFSFNAESDIEELKTLLAKNTKIN